MIFVGDWDALYGWFDSVRYGCNYGRNSLDSTTDTSQSWRAWRLGLMITYYELSLIESCPSTLFSFPQLVPRFLLSLRRTLCMPHVVARR